MNKVRDGLRILLEYSDFEIQPAHDQLFCAPLDVSEDHKTILLNLGWFVECDSWSVFT